MNAPLITLERYIVLDQVYTQGADDVHAGYTRIHADNTRRTHTRHTQDKNGHDLFEMHASTHVLTTTPYFRCTPDTPLLGGDTAA